MWKETNIYKTNTYIVRFHVGFSGVSWCISPNPYPNPILPTPRDSLFQGIFSWIRPIPNRRSPVGRWEKATRERTINHGCLDLKKHPHKIQSTAFWCHVLCNCGCFCGWGGVLRGADVVDVNWACTHGEYYATHVWGGGLQRSLNNQYYFLMLCLEWKQVLATQWNFSETSTSSEVCIGIPFFNLNGPNKSQTVKVNGRTKLAGTKVTNPWLHVTNPVMWLKRHVPSSLKNQEGHNQRAIVWLCLPVCAPLQQKLKKHTCWVLCK